MVLERQLSDDDVDNQPESLLWTTHAGSETGHAVADVRLRRPRTRPADSPRPGTAPSADLPPDLFNYDIVKTDQTYLYFRGDPLYAFGHGLSYTSFGYSGLRRTRSRAGRQGQGDASAST